MNNRNYLKLTLIAGLLLVSLGGFLLHLRAHPPSSGGEDLIPFFSGIVSLLVIPLLFWFRRTLHFAYILNGFLVIIGTVTMAHYSIANFNGPLTLQGIVINTTFMHIMLAWGKFVFGKAIFEIDHLNLDTPMRHGRFFRYPNMGWWWVHLASVAVVYALGNILWK